MAKITHPYGTLPVWGFPVLAALRERCLATDIATLNTGWEDTLVPLGLALAGDAFNDEPMLHWARNWTEYHLNAPTVKPDTNTYKLQNSGDDRRGLYLSPYCGDWGGAMVFAALHNHQPDDALLTAMRMLSDHIIQGSIRLQDGIIAHGHWAIQPWVDTLYYTSAPLARVYAITGDERYAVEAVRQCLLHAKFLRDERTGCFFHEIHLDTNRRTDWLWSRGNGWVVMAFADTLAHCPVDTPRWGEAMSIYRTLINGLLRLQHPSGLWRIVPENEESYLETSGALMIATGIAVGIRHGWIDPSLSDSVLRTWWEALTWINSEGLLMGCQTPAGVGGWDTHKLSQMGNRTYGTGSLLRLVAELRLAKLI